MHTSSPRAACRGGLLGKLLFLLVLLLAVAALAWAFFLPQIVTTALHKRTQFDVTVSELTANPFTSRVVIRGLVLRNPSSFPISDFVHVREFRAELNLPSLFSDRLVIEDAAINIEKLALVKNAAGERNIQLFQERLLGGGTTEDKPATEEPGSDKPREFLIRHLELRFDQLVIADAGNSAPRVLNLNLNHTYKNVDNPTALAAPIAAQLVQRSGILNRLLEKIMPGEKESAK
jgi:uncharacterized protein involved in outer membrane biogenesis